jgi:hypothetical protein
MADNWTPPPPSMYGALSGGTVTGPNPMIPLDVKIKQGQAGAADYAPQKARADAALAGASANEKGTLLPFVVKKTQAEADLAAAKARQASGQPAPLTPQQRADNLFQNDVVLNDVHAAQELNNSGWASGWGGLFAGVPNSDAATLEAKIQGLKSNVVLGNLAKMRQQSTTGSSGMGRVTNQEVQLLASNLGSLGTKSQPALTDTLNNIERSYRRLQLINAGLDPGLADQSMTAPVIGDQSKQQQVVPPMAGGTSAPPGAPGGPPSMPPPGGPAGGMDRSSTVYAPAASSGTALANGGYQTIHDPVLKGVNDHVAGMVQAGASATDINNYMKSLGIDTSTIKGVDAAVAFRQKNPGYKGPYSATVDLKQIPMSFLRSTVNAVAQSPVGVGAMNAANAATVGNLANLTSNPAITAAGLNAASQQHPSAALVGNIGGGAMAISALEGGLGAAGMRGGTGILAPRAMAADAAYGGGYGASSNPDAPISGAVQGAFLGTLGGMGGRGVVRSTASAVAPTGGSLAPFLNIGGKPTIGQRLAGTPGNVVNTIEQAAQSAPLIGAPIRAARAGAREEFERGAFDSALGDIGDKLPTDMPLGTQPHAYMQNAFNNAYAKARAGMQVVPDSQMTTDLGGFQKSLQSGVYNDADVASINKLINNYVGTRFARGGGVLNGDSYKAAMSDLGDAARKMSASRPEAAGAVRDFMGILDDAARRASPPDAVAALDAADQGYAKAVRVEQAAAMRGPSGQGRFSPNEFDRSVQQASGGVRSRAYLRGDALMGDYAQAGKSLSDTMADSQTATRSKVIGGPSIFGRVGEAGTAGAAGYAALHHPYLAGAGLSIPALLAAAPTLPGARQVIGAAMRPRTTPALINIADMMRNNAQWGGRVGAPAALTYRGPGN